MTIDDELDRMEQGHLSLRELGDLHRELLNALDDVREALASAMRREGNAGRTYLELMQLSGYGSMATIVKIMKSSPNPRGPRSFAHSATLPD